MPAQTANTAILDALDRDILAALEDDGRMSFTELATRVNLSANAVAERVRRLERSGVIAGYRAEVDPSALGRRVHAFVDVKLRADTPAQRFEAAVDAIPGVVQITLTTGSFDYSLRVACVDESDLVRLVEALRAAVPIAETYSRIVLRERSPARRR